MHFRDMKGFNRDNPFSPPQPFRETKSIPGRDRRITRKIFIDAGVEHFRVRLYEIPVPGDSPVLVSDLAIPCNDDIEKLTRTSVLKEVFENRENEERVDSQAFFITGKLADITKKVLKQGVVLMPAAVLWSSAKFLFSKEENRGLESLGIIDLSASGYMVICIDKSGALVDDVLVVNPRCGAGSGINLNRILQKLDIRREDVDVILGDYQGPAGKFKREQTAVRSDRCGVFSSSAAVSDKNQGIPLDYALAVTMKSEVLKPCKKMPPGTPKVYLTGGVFRWQYVRECAEDLLMSLGVKEVVYDKDHSLMMKGMMDLAEDVEEKNSRARDTVRLRKSKGLISLPSFKSLEAAYEKEGLFKRMPGPGTLASGGDFSSQPVDVGLDIGSTMAKIVIAGARSGELLFHHSYPNHGDTIETIKHIAGALMAGNIDKLKIQNLGITGSGRYQVQKALKAIYPHLKDRITVMVENYAHAWGSIPLARDYIARLKQECRGEVNQDFCLLIDIGGEDTKISVISLKEGELFDNAMNIKCSAGTGSLMDTLDALFGIGDIAAAYGKAMAAREAYAINATCAVFLMENARKMQAEGYGKEEILASCCYAIVENMARSLWNQVEFPRNTLALLHGQTMLSDPLPLAVTRRIQEYTELKTFCLVPPLPGHRACIGLVKKFENLPGRESREIDTYCRLEDLLERKFERKIIECRGAACGDKNARCARTSLESTDVNGRISLTLGGCTAVNELQARETLLKPPQVPNAYHEIREFIDRRMPRSEDKRRLVIPRCFALSERAFFFGKMCEYWGIPVHIDNVKEKDILAGQPFFTIDTCAPNIGAAGQFLRLAQEDHGIILVPQIDFLPIEGACVGRTCTTNQGGPLLALNLAQRKYPGARFRFFDVSLKNPDPRHLALQLFPHFQSIFTFYGLQVSPAEFTRAIIDAAQDYEQLKTDTADLAADFIEAALDKKLNVAVVNAREYILDPGIYDSHIGKLLHDKGVVAIPTYVFDTSPDQQFDYIYWKNPHDLLTRANAIAQGRFHHFIKHSRLKELIQRIETGHDQGLLSLVTVSTFRCGPDSITLPVLAEITKNIPSLLIQSDAMIAELAHLENRVNTHLNQLNKGLHSFRTGQDNNQSREENFSVALLEEFRLDNLCKETDVLYFPTLNDNRVITSVFRGAGFTAVDNFDDDTYDLEEKAKTGRKYVGDAACVPLAAVFTDMMQAVEDFIKRKKTGDPLVKGKERVVLFMHYGDGPCRQGQFIDICKFNLYRKFRSTLGPGVRVSSPGSFTPITPFPIKFLANIATDLHGQKDFLSELEEWTVIQGFQALILKEVLIGIFLKGGGNCRDYREYQEFNQAYRQFKQEIYQHLEQEIKPGSISRFLVNKIGKIIPGLGGIARYFGYGLYNNNGLRKRLREFGSRWLQSSSPGMGEGRKKLNIYVEGEVYLRVAQVDEIFKFLVDTLGFGSFTLSYSPLWAYFEYILGIRIYLTEKDIDNQKFLGGRRPQPKKALRAISRRTDLCAEDSRNNYQKFLGVSGPFFKKVLTRRRQILETAGILRQFRGVLAGPLYRAAGLAMPHPIEVLFSLAQPVIPSLKPTGELVPYVGETISQIKEGADLVLNVAPEGCMVASMGEMLTPAILEAAGNKNARVQHLFNTEGELNEELLRLSLLKVRHAAHAPLEARPADGFYSHPSVFGGKKR